MKPTFYLLLAFLSFSLNAQKNIHHRWDRMLQEYVDESGQVNYKSWYQNQDNLDAYIKTLSNLPPHESDSKNSKLAYWINAYNAYTIQLILDNYPLKSIKDITDPWSQTFFKINGKTMSLNTIEHNILRPMGDPRIHFAIVYTIAICYYKTLTQHTQTLLSYQRLTHW